MSSENVVKLKRSRPRAWAFYIVCDVSNSMWREDGASGRLTPYQTISDSLPQLVRDLNDDEQARDIAHISVVSFSDGIQEIVPLTRLRDVKALAILGKGTFTDYQKIFSYLAHKIALDSGTLREKYDIYTPTVFFLTDGYPQVKAGVQPEVLWRVPLDKLKDKQFVSRPSLVAMGFGNAGEEVLKIIASNTPGGVACIAENGVPSSDLLQAILDSIVFSITNSTDKGQLVFEIPSGMRRII